MVKKVHVRKRIIKFKHLKRGPLTQSRRDLKTGKILGIKFLGDISWIIAKLPITTGEDSSNIRSPE